MLILLAIPSLFASELVRVDIPDHPQAIATSATGSTLLGPPEDGTPYRPEPVPETTGTAHDGWTALEALDAMGVGPWHAAGFDGSGVKVAVFDIQWFGLEQHPTLSSLSNHDCFGHRSCALPIDTIRPQFAFETGKHGIACAEVVQAIAPGAELHLVRVNGLTALENAVAWAVREEMDLVSMSMSFFSESFYDGTGSINSAVDALVDAGILLVNSAGNYARQHRADTFIDRDSDGRHEFEWGSELLPIYLPEGSTKITLSWDEYRRCGATDLDAYLYDEAGDLVSRSTRPQSIDNDNCFPVESFTVEVDDASWHYLLIHRDAGRSVVDFKVMTRRGQIYDATAEGSVTDPGSHPHVFTVGAVLADGYRLNEVETFSSQGPTSAGADKPDITGPDGLTTSAYGQKRFYGTSAATPAVAGALALMLSEDPTLTPREAALALQASAIAMTPAWAEPEPSVGAGKAHLPPLSEVHRGCGRGAPLLMVLFWLPLSALRRRN